MREFPNARRSESGNPPGVYAPVVSTASGQEIESVRFLGVDALQLAVGIALNLWKINQTINSDSFVNPLIPFPYEDA